LLLEGKAAKIKAGSRTTVDNSKIMCIEDLQKFYLTSYFWGQPTCT